MKIGDIVKSRHTGQEYRVVEMNKKHKKLFLNHGNQKKIFGYFYKIIKSQNGESSSEKIIESKKFGISELC